MRFSFSGLLSHCDYLSWQWKSTNKRKIDNDGKRSINMTTIFEMRTFIETVINLKTRSKWKH